MENLGLMLNPFSKLKIYDVAKHLVLQKMNNHSISPARADELITFLRDNLPKIQTAKEAKDFYFDAAKDFPEFVELPLFFENREDEKLEKVIIALSEILMERDLEMSAKIVEKLKSLPDISSKEAFMATLEAKFPEECDLAVEQVIKKN